MTEEPSLEGMTGQQAFELSAPVIILSVAAIGLLLKKGVITKDELAENMPTSDTQARREAIEILEGFTL